MDLGKIKYNELKEGSSMGPHLDDRAQNCVDLCNGALREYRNSQMKKPLCRIGAYFGNLKQKYFTGKDNRLEGSV